MSRSKMPHRRYTYEFRTEAVRLAQEVGVTEAARRLGCTRQALVMLRTRYADFPKAAVQVVGATVYAWPELRSYWHSRSHKEDQS